MDDSFSATVRTAERLGAIAMPRQLSMSWGKRVCGTASDRSRAAETRGIVVSAASASRGGSRSTLLAGGARILRLLRRLPELDVAVAQVFVVLFARVLDELPVHQRERPHVLPRLGV